MADLEKILKQALARLKPVTKAEQDAFISKRSLAHYEEIARERDVSLSPLIFADATSPRQITEAISALRSWKAWAKTREHRTPAIVILSGGVGVGKSVALSRAALLAKTSALYTTARKLSLPKEWERDTVLPRAKRVRLLAIDELCELDSAERVTSILLERYDAGLTTIAATNLSPSQIRERYLSGPDGDRLRDRLRAQASVGLKAIWSLKGESLR